MSIHEFTAPATTVGRAVVHAGDDLLPDVPNAGYLAKFGWDVFEGVPFTNVYQVQDDVHVNSLRREERGGEAHISFICDTRPYIGSDEDVDRFGAHVVLDPGGQSVLLRE